jgi:hypothetical protein
MKIAIAALALILCSGAASAQGIYGNSNSGTYGNSGLSGTGSNPNSHSVQPHFNSNGSYTQGHQATNPNNTQLDNYGTRGNLNPYTGTYGTRSPGY